MTWNFISRLNGGKDIELKLNCITFSESLSFVFEETLDVDYYLMVLLHICGIAIYMSTLRRLSPCLNL